MIKQICNWIIELCESFWTKEVMRLYIAFIFIFVLVNDVLPIMNSLLVQKIITIYIFIIGISVALLSLREAIYE